MLWGVHFIIYTEFLYLFLGEEMHFDGFTKCRNANARPRRERSIAAATRAAEGLWRRGGGGWAGPGGQAGRVFRTAGAEWRGQDDDHRNLRGADRGRRR